MTRLALALLLLLSLASTPIAAQDLQKGYAVYLASDYASAQINLGVIHGYNIQQLSCCSLLNSCFDTNDIIRSFYDRSFT